MKTILLSAIMIFSGASIYSQNAFRGGQCIVKAEFIYQPSEVIFPSCHASTICQTREGLLAAWFGGTAEGNPDVAIWTSRYINGGWTRPEEAANGVQHKSKRYPCWNPVLYNSGDTVLLFFKVGPSPSAWWGEVKYSCDNGRSWSVSRRLPEDILGPVKNKPVKLKNGELLCPSSSENDGWRVHMEFTSGLATSWERTSFLNDREIYAIQPSVLVHPGSLQLLCRTKQSKIYTAWSGDNGRKWTELMPLCLPNPDAGIDALTLANGKFLVVYNHLSAGRHILNTAVSENGTDWKAIALLEKGHQGSEYSYPAVIQTDDGLVHITYTWDRKLIKHVVIDPEKASSLPIVNGNWPEKRKKK